MRVLEPGGIIYLSNARSANITIAERLGLKVIRMNNVDQVEPGDLYEVAFQKDTGDFERQAQ